MRWRRLERENGVERKGEGNEVGVKEEEKEEDLWSWRGGK